MVGAKSNLKGKASKALETVKNNPDVQKAGENIKGVAKKAGQKIAEQQIKSKVSGLAT